jgi:hypothetical protein
VEVVVVELYVEEIKEQVELELEVLELQQEHQVVVQVLNQN